MSRPLSPAQRAVAEFIAAKFAETKLPVTRFEIAVGLNSPRGLTSTLASLIERDAIMPLHRVGAAESFVPASERIPQLAKLLKLDPAEKDVEKRIRARLAGIGVKDVCGRCGGSGRYSFNMIDGDRCWGCSGHQYVAAPLTTAKTWVRAVDAVEAGKLDEYLAARAARADALAQIKPLRTEIEALSKAISAQTDRAFGGWAQLSRIVDGNVTIGRSVRSYAHRHSVHSGNLLSRSWDVESAVKSGKIDPEVGAFFAVAILTEVRDELRALLDRVTAMTDDELRAPVHADFECKFCKKLLSVYGDSESGRTIVCFHPWVRDGSVGCGFKNTAP